MSQNSFGKALGTSLVRNERNNKFEIFALHMGQKRYLMAPWRHMAKIPLEYPLKSRVDFCVPGYTCTRFRQISIFVNNGRRNSKELKFVVHSTTL